MPSFLREGVVTIFAFFVFLTVYLVLSSLGYATIAIWIFLVLNMFFMTISLFLAVQANEKSLKEYGHEANIFWVLALGIFVLVGVLLQFVFLLESREFTPPSIALAGTLTSITVTYFFMTKDMHETKAPLKR